jgi:hypothetical protein
MAMLNRMAVIIKCKQPFLDWIQKADRDRKYKFETLEQLNREPSTFLIPEFGSHDHFVKRGEVVKAWIAQEMFHYLIEDEDLWPPEALTLDGFHQYFDFECWEPVFEGSRESLEFMETIPSWDI